MASVQTGNTVTSQQGLLQTSWSDVLSTASVALVLTLLFLTAFTSPCTLQVGEFVPETFTLIQFGTVSCQT